MNVAIPPDRDVVLLDHGSGGVASRRLIEEVIASSLGSACESSFEDSAVLPSLGTRIAFTTDSFVVSPVEFLNGSIGKIAVCGTVNDLAASGASPAYLSLSLILEEGFSLTKLRRLLHDVRDAALSAQVRIVCGDTKVVEKGAIDGITINTAGVGFFTDGQIPFSQSRIRSGDSIILSTYAGDHGIHILSMREGLGFERNVPSDCAPLNAPIRALSDALSDALHCVRDVTRGGLGTILHEIAAATDFNFLVERNHIPLRPETIMAADMLGVDPLHLANEGCFVAFLDPTMVEEALKILRTFPCSSAATAIGSVATSKGGKLVSLSNEPPITVLDGRVLPRLC